MAKTNTKLKNAQSILKEFQMTCDDFSNHELANFKNQMDGLDDKRHHSYIRHRIGDIIVIVFLALLSDADEWNEIELFAKKKEKWLRKFLTLDYGIPSHDTIQNVISMIEPQILFHACISFLMAKIDVYSEMATKQDAFKKTELPIVSIDGKTSRGSAGNDTGQGEIRPLHTLNAVSSDYGFCIGQVFVPEKSNEIVAVEDLLDLIDIEGAVVTWDALNTQKKNINKVIKNKGDYVVALKSNHPNLSEEVIDYFSDEELLKDNPLVCTCKTTEKEHSAVITREYILSKEVNWIYDKKSWKELNTIGCVRKTIHSLTGEESTETRYFISSVLDVSLFARSVRQHWAVESFHWQMDFTFHDDANKTREKKSVKNLQIMKKAALALIKLVQPMYKMSMKRIRYSLSLDFENDIEKIFSALDVEKVTKVLIENDKRNRG